jgi:hypothetical protein
LRETRAACERRIVKPVTGEVERLRAALEPHSPVLREALRAALTERTFPPHPRFRGRTPPRLDEADALAGVHVILCYPDWQPAIGGLSRARAWKCGVRIPFSPRPADPWTDDPEGSDVFDAAVHWIIDAWRAVRDAARELRGLVSEHDGGEMIDLDSGQAVPDAAVDMGAL